MVNWIDVIIIVVTACIALVAYRHGLISLAFTIGGLFLGVFLASRYHAFLGDNSGQQTIAFVIVLVGVIIAANVLGAILKRMLSIAQLGWLDKAGAAVLGVVVGLMICAAVLAVLAKAATFDTAEIPAGRQEVQQALQESQEWISTNISQSVLARFLLAETPVVRALLPGDFEFLEFYFV